MHTYIHKTQHKHMRMRTFHVCIYIQKFQITHTHRTSNTAYTENTDLIYMEIIRKETYKRTQT
jgi:hypothetical protein